MSQRTHQPLVIVIGGPNGAGKSTLAERVLEPMGIRDFVNADTIARGISRFAPETVAAQAGRIMLERIRVLGQDRADFAFETTLSGRAHAGFLRRLVDAGYRFELVAVWLRSPQLAVERVATRVQSGGHHIPLEDIKRRYWRSAYNLLNLYIPLADAWKVYDNSGNSPYILMAEGARGEPTKIIERSLFDDLQDAASHERA